MLAALLLFANTVGFGGGINDEELPKVWRSVWIKWFENDQEALKKLAPTDTVVISTGEPGIKHQPTYSRARRHFMRRAGS